MGWIWNLLLLVVSVAAVVAASRRMRRPDDEVDGDHERDFEDPPSIDGFGRPGGGTSG